MRLLAIEDERELAALLHQALAHAGFAVDVAYEPRHQRGKRQSSWVWFGA